VRELSFGREDVESGEESLGWDVLGGESFSVTLWVMKPFSSFVGVAVVTVTWSFAVGQEGESELEAELEALAWWEEGALMTVMLPKEGRGVPFRVLDVEEGK
jgi:hypothetical protein